MFGVAVSPVSKLVAILLAVFPSSAYLLALGPLFTAIQIPLLYGIARRATGSVAFALALAFSFAANPLIEIYSFLGYKPEPIGNSFVLLFIFGVLARRGRLAAVAAVLAVLAKIEYLPVVFLAAAGFWPGSYKTVARPATFVTGAVGLAYFAIVVALLVLVPLPPWTQDNTLTPLIDLVRHGGLFELLGRIASPFNARLALLLFPTAFLALLSPYFAFVPAIVHLGFTLLFSAVLEESRLAQLYLPLPDSVWLHAPRPPVAWVPLLYVATAFGVARLARSPRLGKRGTKRALAAAALAVALAGVAYHVLAAVPLAGPLPLSPYWNAMKYRYAATERSRRIDDVLAEVEADPARACVTLQLATALSLRTGLATADRVAFVPCERDRERPARIVVDLFLASYPTRKEILDWTLASLADPAYDVASVREGVLVLRRRAGDGSSAARKEAVRAFLAANRDVLDLMLMAPKDYRDRLRTPLPEADGADGPTRPVRDALP
jgi:hypothetical protein